MDYFGCPMCPILDECTWAIASLFGSGWYASDIWSGLPVCLVIHFDFLQHTRNKPDIFLVFTGLRCADEVMTVYKGTGTNDDVLTGDQLKRLARHRYSAQGQSLLDPYMQVTYNWWLGFETDGMVYIQSSQVIKLSDWCVRSEKWMALHVLIADISRKSAVTENQLFCCWMMLY